jgi:hypothetical protein
MPPTRARKALRALRWILAGLAGLVLLLGLFVALFLDSLARRGMESVSSHAMGVAIELGELRLKLRGRVEIERATVGNPAEYREAVALRIARLDAYLDRGSLTGSEIRIPDMIVTQPDFTVEFRDGVSNVAVLVDRLLSAIPADAPKFRIERLRVREAVVRVRSGEIKGGETVFRLPDLELQNFGDAPGTAPTGRLVAALFLQLLAGGAMEQEDTSFPSGLRKSFKAELERSSAAFKGAGPRRP